MLFDVPPEIDGLDAGYFLIDVLCLFRPVVEDSSPSVVFLTADSFLMPSVAVEKFERFAPPVVFEDTDGLVLVPDVLAPLDTLPGYDSTFFLKTLALGILATVVFPSFLVSFFYYSILAIALALSYSENLYCKKNSSRFM